jgi:hypothetical protein
MIEIKPTKTAALDYCYFAGWGINENTNQSSFFLHEMLVELEETFLYDCKYGCQNITDFYARGFNDMRTTPVSM